MRIGSLRLFLFVLAGLIVGGAAALAVFPQARERLLPAPGVKIMGQALVGGPFQLTDHTGKRVSDQDYRGRYALVFFGFTFCPDVCPSALQVMSAALDKIGPKADRNKFLHLFSNIYPNLKSTIFLYSTYFYA
jgi:protein SCO1/2